MAFRVAIGRFLYVSCDEFQDFSSVALKEMERLKPVEALSSNYTIPMKKAYRHDQVDLSPAKLETRAYSRSEISRPQLKLLAGHSIP